MIWLLLTSVLGFQLLLPVRGSGPTLYRDASSITKKTPPTPFWDQGGTTIDPNG